jgi:hypothetical protein
VPEAVSLSWAAVLKKSERKTAVSKLNPDLLIIRIQIFHKGKIKNN